jgi:hypothetical protein
MCWVLPEALVGSRNSPCTFRRNLPTHRGKKGRYAQRVLLLSILQKAGSRITQIPQRWHMITVTSQANCPLLGTANTKVSPWIEEDPFMVAKMSWARDVTGESMDVLMDFCSQNTLRNERLEHMSYRQERNFTDKG